MDLDDLQERVRKQWDRRLNWVFSFDMSTEDRRNMGEIARAMMLGVTKVPDHKWEAFEAICQRLK